MLHEIRLPDLVGRINEGFRKIRCRRTAGADNRKMAIASGQSKGNQQVVQSGGGEEFEWEATLRAFNGLAHRRVLSFSI